MQHPLGQKMIWLAVREIGGGHVMHMKEVH